MCFFKKRKARKEAEKKAEQERLEKERIEQERLEQEKIAKEKAAEEKAKKLTEKKKSAEQPKTTVKKSAPKKEIKEESKKEEVKQTEDVNEEQPKARKAVYRVLFDKEDNLWKIKKDGAKRIIGSMRTKEEALARVQELCANQNSNFVVYKKDGKFQKKANLKLKTEKKEN